MNSLTSSTTSSDSSGHNQRVVSSQDLLQDARELVIEHGRERYRLLLTKSNKLILIK